jgi:hypothetical protein
MLMATVLHHKSTISKQSATQKKPAICRTFSIHLAKIKQQYAYKSFTLRMFLIHLYMPDLIQSRLYTFYRQSVPDSQFHFSPFPKQCQQSRWFSLTWKEVDILAWVVLQGNCLNLHWRCSDVLILTELGRWLWRFAPGYMAHLVMDSGWHSSMRQWFILFHHVINIAILAARCN